MGYEKQTWAEGDVVTSEKLNHMEDGIASSIMVITATVTESEGETKKTLDKTWQEIFDKFSTGSRCLIDMSYEGSTSFSPVMTMGSDSEYGYVVDVFNVEGGTSKILSFECNAPTGYPASTIGR